MEPQRRPYEELIEQWEKLVADALDLSSALFRMGDRSYLGRVTRSAYMAEIDAERARRTNELLTAAGWTEYEFSVEGDARFLAYLNRRANGTVA